MWGIVIVIVFEIAEADTHSIPQEIKNWNKWFWVRTGAECGLNTTNPIKRIPIKRLYNEPLDFEVYHDAIRKEAQTHWRLMMRYQRRVSM
jgi:hypothetical protein